MPNSSRAVRPSSATVISCGLSIIRDVVRVRQSRAYAADFPVQKARKSFMKNIFHILIVALFDSTTRAGWRKGTRLLRLAGATMLVTSRVGSAQALPNSGAQNATRAQLAGLLADTERQLAAATKKDARTQLAADVSAIKKRLDAGDFRVGDRFFYVITQDSVRGDTALVRDGLVVSIWNLPDFSVNGVLRSELTDQLSLHLAKYLKRTTVRTTILTRVQITGAVARPGYYTIIPDRPISEILMLAGGPAQNAKLDEVEIRRGDVVVLSAKASKQAMKEGRTAEQLNLQSGDAVSVPLKKKLNWTGILQAFSIISVVFFSVISFIQWYYSRQQN